MTLEPGTRVGAYEIVAPLGAGGMGEVYRATDPRLGRQVAVKVLPRPDAETIARFEREARAVAALSHPNILEIHEFGYDGGAHYLVTELLEGETLRERLRRQQLPWQEAVRIAGDICDGLAAAHAKSIVHRDLKPENVFLTHDGRVKILDFGLARVDSDSATRESMATEFKTATGTVLGTFAYMSPEQVRGEAAGPAADIFAVGCIIYEMISGRPAFGRTTASETISAVLRDDPPDVAGVPAELRSLIRDCLAKEAARRPSPAGDLGFAFRRTMRDRGRSWLPVAIVAAAAATVLAAYFVISRRTGPAQTGPGPQSTTLTQVSFSKEVEQFPAWSPDGSRIVFSRETGTPRKLFIRTIGDANETQLTQGDDDDILPFWSPDGKTVLFVRSNRPGQRVAQSDVFAEYSQGDIWSIEVRGGTEQLLIRDAYEPAVSPDGERIAFSAPWSGAHRIWVSDRRGRNPQQITSDTSEAVGHLRPRWSPDGQLLVFQHRDRTQFDIRTVDLATKTLRTVTHDATLDVNPVWAPGHFVYFSSYRGGGINVWRVRVGSDGSVQGQPDQVTTGAGQDIDLSISADGKRLALATLRQNSDLWRLPVTPYGLASGRPEEFVATTREETRGAWSRDGGAIAFSSDRTGDMNIWVRTLSDGLDRQITRGAGGDYQADWSPDGSRIVFFSGRADSIDIWDVDARTGALRRLTNDPASETHPFYSPDGRQIAYMSDAGGRLELWLMNADGSAQRQVTREGIGVHFIRWSRDGETLLFPSLSHTPPRLVTMAAAGGREIPMGLVMGGAHVSYSPDRERIMDVVNHRTLWVSPLDSGAPQKVFEFDDAQVRIDYPVWSPDGRSVLFDRSRPEGGDIWMLEDFQELPASRS